MKFIQVRDDKNAYYGGDQAWFDSKTTRGYGCGIIACVNTIFGIQKKRIITKQNYMSLADIMAKKYLHALPILGINGLSLAWGINRYFRDQRLPYLAWWGCLPGNIWRNVQRMLDAGIAPVLAIGPTWPFLFRNVKLGFYAEKNAAVQPRTQIKAHYVSITDLDDEWVTISSWGKRYYIRRDEYERYMKRYSNILYSNILCIKKKPQNDFNDHYLRSLLKNK